MYIIIIHENYLQLRLSAFFTEYRIIVSIRELCKKNAQNKRVSSKGYLTSTPPHPLVTTIYVQDKRELLSKKTIHSSTNAAGCTSSLYNSFL